MVRSKLYRAERLLGIRRASVTSFNRVLIFRHIVTEMVVPRKVGQQRIRRITRSTELANNGSFKTPLHLGTSPPCGFSRLVKSQNWNI
jgi:hypothetical protein